MMRCRDCGEMLDPVLDLGLLKLSTFSLSPTTITAPLDLCACRTCQLVQLSNTVPPDLMFREYWYRSGVNETMRAELADVVTKARRLVPIHHGDIVVDIGANDGTLLSNYHGMKILKVAYEPARGLIKDLHEHADVVVDDYFPSPSFALRSTYTGRAKIVTSIAMFYDLDRPHEFVNAIQQLLHPKGVWVVQFQDLHQMIQANAFDNIVHEHLCYYSLRSFGRLIEQHGLMVTHAERRAINGGSLRLYVQHTGTDAASRSVDELRRAEFGCDGWDSLERFAWRVGEVRTQIQAALHEANQLGPVDLYGASTKFNTLAQYCGIDASVIQCAWERSPEKWGLRTVTGIPIVSEEQGRGTPPTILLVGIWQFREAILKREAAFLEGGGHLLFPLPQVDLVQGATT